MIKSSLISPEGSGACLIFPDQRVDVEVEYSFDDGEDREDDGGHGDGGEAGQAAEAVRDTLGGQRLTPRHRQDAADHQEEQQHCSRE